MCCRGVLRAARSRTWPFARRAPVVVNSQTRAWAATRRSCRHERAHTTCPTCTSVAGCEPQTPCVACAPDAARAVGVTSHQTCTSDATGLFRSILFAYALYLAYKMIRRLLKPQVVRLLFKDTQRNRRLLAKCPSLAKYAPTPWLMVRTDTSWPAAYFLGRLGVSTDVPGAVLAPFRTATCRRCSLWLAASSRAR